MATSKVVSLDIYRGDFFSKKFLIGTQNIDGTVTGIDLTAYGDLWAAQLRKSEDSDESIDFTVDDSDADTGYITISLTAEQTAALPAKGTWDLQVTDTGQSPARPRTFIKAATFTLTKDTTHD